MVFFIVKVFAMQAKKPSVSKTHTNPIGAFPIVNREGIMFSFQSKSQQF